MIPKFNTQKIIDEIGGIAIKIDNKNIYNISTISEPLNNSVMFVSESHWKDNYTFELNRINNAMIIIEPQLEQYFTEIACKNVVVVTENARLYFAKTLQLVLNIDDRNRHYSRDDSGIVIGQNVTVGDSCTFEPNVFIDHDVTIGDGVHIKTGAVIRKNTVLKNNVVIGENSVIGAQGLGVETDQTTGDNIRIPHVGGVIIEENVEIGALSSVCAGTIKPTIIGKNSFIDDLNHIAHNCNVGEGTISTGCVEMSGSAIIGKRGYISPNCTIRNGISIGNNCFVGQASSVQKDFGDDVSLVGSPAKEFYKK